MRICSVELKPWSFPITAGNAKSNWSVRTGSNLILRADGFVSEGEIAPLPGYSHESLQSALAGVPPLLGQRLRDLEELRALVAQVPPELPSVRFGVETAGIGLLCAREACTPESLLGVDAPVKKPVAETLTELSLDPVRAHSTLGIETIKVKVGRKNRALEELRFLKTLRGEFPRLRIRLDANRQFQAEAYANIEPELALLGVEFIEEPTEALFGPSDVAVALDETLRHPEAALRVLESLPVRALVLKPAVLGGVLPCLDWVDRARGIQPQLDFVASHLFDGEVSGKAVCTLARCLPSDVAQAVGHERAGGNVV